MDGGRALFSAWDEVGEGHIREQGRSLTGQEIYTCDMVPCPSHGTHLGECQDTFWTQEASERRDQYSPKLQAKLTISKHCN